jgi:hypothetical protein
MKIEWVIVSGQAVPCLASAAAVVMRVMSYETQYLDLALHPSVEELSFPVGSRWQC